MRTIPVKNHVAVTSIALKLIVPDFGEKGNLNWKLVCHASAGSRGVIFARTADAIYLFSWMLASFQITSLNQASLLWINLQRAVDFYAVVRANGVRQFDTFSPNPRNHRR